jgi:serine protease
LQNTIAIQRPLENDYLWFQGTSMAAPHVAGVAALVVSAGVTNPDEVERILEETAVHPHGLEWDPHYGAGIVDAAAAVTAARQHYAPERGALVGLMVLGTLAGFGLPRSRKGGCAIASTLGLVGGSVLAGGALGPSLVGGMGGLAAGVLGPAAMGSWWIWSPALPVLLAMLFLGVRAGRGLLAGLSLGYAALLLHGAAVLPCVLSFPGGPAFDRGWLALNAILALVLAVRIHRLSQTQTVGSSPGSPRQADAGRSG